MEHQGKTSIRYEMIHEDSAGQRLDHFLSCLLKKVPKSFICRIIRQGQVRINKKRTQTSYRLLAGDLIRIPPLIANDKKESVSAYPILTKPFSILFEDDAFLAIDKPSNIASHGGSGISYGVIEQLRKMRPEARYLQLVHRLDKETSGVLMVAKKHSALVKLHEILKKGLALKNYYALALGSVSNNKQNIKIPLQITKTRTGQKQVQVNPTGVFAHTIVKVVTRYPDFTLVDVCLKTGRTHQIRVHLQHLGHPIVGDQRYGDFIQNKILAKKGFKRMFLHAYQITIPHPIHKTLLTINSPLPKDLENLLVSPIDDYTTS